MTKEKSNILTKTFNKREMEQMREKFARDVAKVGRFSAEQMARAAEHDGKRDALDDLISDTRELIVSSGYEIPNSYRDRSKAEVEFLESAAPEFAKNKDLQSWPAERVAEIVSGMIAATQDPQTRLYSAYGSFMAADEARKADDHKSAVLYVAMGATGLVQAVASLHANQRRDGGNKKKTQNVTAIQKAKAIEESRRLWAEREAGKHPKLGTEDQLAIEVARRWPAIASISSIKKRSAKWRKEKKRAPK